ncbi:MAG: DUF1343 domain-containing protein [Peptoniphilaceae bacterium]
MKKLFNLLLIFSLIFIASNRVYATTASPSPQKLYLNGNLQDLRGYNINGYNYFKIRDLANILRDRIDFSLSGDSKSIKLNLNNNYKIKKDDLRKINNTNKYAIYKNIEFEIIKEYKITKSYIKAYNIDGYNYFKLRDLSNILEFSVSYNKLNNSAEISTYSSASLDLSYKKDSKFSGKVILGNERILDEYSYLIDNKNIGLVTNMTGIDSNNIFTYDKLKNYSKTNLVSLYSPEHGLRGDVEAGKYVESYIDKDLNLPVYSLYGDSRKPSREMLKNIDLLLFDMQDIGSRTYTYMSTLNYIMKAAKENNIPIVVLDRPNPLGDKVEGFVLKDKYKTFVGVDNLPMAHGMTAGELAKFFNRNINAELTVIKMKNYKRNMIWQETGLNFVQTSPNIPNIESAFLYMATGIGDGTGLAQDDKFKFVGAKGLDANKFAKNLNSCNLPGVTFYPMNKGSRGGVRLEINDYKTFNPQLTGTYIIATANKLCDLNIPRENKGKIPMFEKIMGSDEMGKLLIDKQDPEKIINYYQKELNDFKKIRKNYLIYN